MSPAKHTERPFEDAIELALTSDVGKFIKGDPKAFDAECSLFQDDVIAFIRTSQPKKWEALEGLQGSKTGEILIAALEKEIKAKGALHVLRHGFKCFGKTYQLAAFAPATGMNPAALQDYQNNICRITRQVKFNPNTNQSVDVVLSVNGLPVVIAELKNPMSGQRVADACTQYEDDRDPRLPLFRFKTGALVHFAVDPDLVFMTTKLAGKETRWLPFNRGNDLGAGNAPIEGDYKTSYLWNGVLQRDSLMDILARFMHLEFKERQVQTASGVRTVRNETMIFPRYHQLDAVRKLVSHAKAHGSGHNCLVQHSAGSGKSNSIAWLAHQLSNLHDTDDNKIFDSVVIITDRRVLDQQLQDTVFQFEHKKGVVQKIDEDTQQLAKALGSGVPIIISTVQKFPFIAQALGTLAKKGEEIKIDTAGNRYAIIVDEAHSSAAGETAQALRRILNSEGIEAAVAAQMLSGDDDDDGLSVTARENLLREMAKRPRQPNLSYFAFTATPKFKTRALFDEPGHDGHSPFHLYSMRQAIEEGFIMDVLANYTTYNAYFGLIKSAEDDPEVPQRKAAKALARFLAMHPHNIAQKVEVIVEHFRRVTRHRIGGRAKAMVVTGSRESAVRYKLALDDYIKKKGYTGIKALVAFTGDITLKEIPDKKFTEVGMNDGIRERELAEKFDTDAYQVLIVAEKYQTGFDQPLLHTMYVDKRLAGIQAVQTLSRLNRNALGKDDTFVLDFVNERHELFDAFKQFHGATEMGEMPDPQRLNEIHHEIEASPVLDPADINEFCEVWFRLPPSTVASEHKQLNAIIDKAIQRFNQLDDNDKDELKSRLVTFRKLYTFMAQIIPYQDSDLEKLYTYARFLILKLPPRPNAGKVDLEDEIKLKLYRLQKESEGEIDLYEGEARPVKGPTEVGTGIGEEQHVLLSKLIDQLNERFGTEFTPADQLFFDQIIETAAEERALQTAAQANTLDNFSYVLARVIDSLMIDRLDGNEAIFDRYSNDKEFRDVAFPHMARRIYDEIRRRNNH